tara:strand:- start:5108 stop:5701 length:594 start_codon:yes stop_codon:yes gene_type:complete
MASQVQIAKLALQHIGDRYDIADISEESVEAEQINLVFDDTRDELLRRYPWRFAKKYTKPATLTVTVPGLWTYAYQYPSACVKVRGITNSLGFDAAALEFEIALLDDDTKVILTNEEDAELFYTSQVTDTSRFDSEFTMAFSFLLASRSCMSLTGSLEVKAALDQEVLRVMGHASETDSSEGRTRSAPEASWIDARQ